MKYPYQTLNSDISKDVKDLILYSIKNPLTFILRDDKDGLTDDTFSGNWIYGAYKGTSALDASNKLWGSDFVDKSGNLALNATFSGKTIYDPCPVGWCIPPQDTWTNFTKNTPEQWNNYNIAGTTGSGTFIKYYNCPVEDQKNWTDGDGMGFMKAPVFGRRFTSEEREVMLLLPGRRLSFWERWNYKRCWKWLLLLVIGTYLCNVTGWWIFYYKSFLGVSGGIYNPIIRNTCPLC